MDASNRKDIRAAEKRAKLHEERRRNFLVSAMSIPEGRAWIHSLLESCKLFNVGFTADALRDAFTAGERNIGLVLFAEILAWAPDSYILMTKEANYERSAAAAEQPRSQNTDGGAQGAFDPYDEPDND